MRENTPVPDASTDRGVHPRVEKLAAYSWRLIVIAIAALAVLWLIRRTAVVFAPIVIALFLSRALSPVVNWLRDHRWRSGLAALTVMLTFFAVIALVITFAVRSFAGEIESIGPTLREALDDIEDWVVEDAPIDVSRQTVEEFRQRAGDQLGELISTNGDFAGGATLAVEIVTGLFLAVILTFFMLRDGRRFTDVAIDLAPESRRPRLRRAVETAWSTLAGYLRGATILGVVEATTIGIASWLAGGGLVAPVMALTFLGAFVPIVGAVAAGVTAVLVALVTGGLGTAVVVGIVALAVQQLDNDVLAPVIYGRALRLHPAMVLVSVVAGGALFGVVGAILAVPIVAVATNAGKAYWSR